MEKNYYSCYYIDNVIISMLFLSYIVYIKLV